MEGNFGGVQDIERLKGGFKKSSVESNGRCRSQNVAR
jgi:hypothetical protein